MEMICFELHDVPTLVPLPHLCESFRGGAFYTKICHLGGVCPVSIGPLQEGLWQSGQRNGRDLVKRLIIRLKHPVTVQAFKKQFPGPVIGV